MTNFYIASKVIHAGKWKKLREDGWPVNATWIDFGEYGTITDWADHWVKCINEASGSTFCLAYCEEGEVLKGALCEIGAALAADKRVLFVGNYDYVKAKRYSIMEHPLVTKFDSLEAALDVIAEHETASRAGNRLTIDVMKEIVEAKKQKATFDINQIGKTIADMLTRK